MSEPLKPFSHLKTTSGLCGTTVMGSTSRPRPAQEATVFKDNHRQICFFLALRDFFCAFTSATVSDLSCDQRLTACQ
jgi:hypothetical protein